MWTSKFKASHFSRAMVLFMGRAKPESRTWNISPVFPYTCLGLACEGWQNMPPQYMTVGVQQMALKNMPLWYIDHFELWALENRKCRERLPRNCPYRPKDISQNECSCHKSSLWEFHHLAKIGSYHWRGDYKLTPYADTVTNWPTSHLLLF